MRTDTLALADLHLDLLYERDAAGLMVRSRDPSVPTPSLHLFRTTAGNRWLVSASVAAAQRKRLDAALSAEPIVGDIDDMEGTPPNLHDVGAILGQVEPRELRGPAFFLPDALLPSANGSAELLNDTTAVSARTVPELAWIRDARPHLFPVAVARDSFGLVVAVCHSARSTPAAAEAGVETAWEYRRRGLALQVVATWAAAVRAEGRLPLYSTEWTNHASRGVARKLGLIQYGEDCHFGWM